MTQTFSLGLQRAPAPSKRKKKRRGSAKLQAARRLNKYDDSSSSDESIGKPSKTNATASTGRSDSGEWISTQKVQEGERIFKLGKFRDSKPSKPIRSYLRDGEKLHSERDEFDFSSSDDEGSCDQPLTAIGRGRGSTPISMGRSAKKQAVSSTSKGIDSMGANQSGSSSSDDSSHDDVQLLQVKPSNKQRLTSKHSSGKQNSSAKPKKNAGYESSSSSSSSDESSSQEAQKIVKVKQGHKPGSAGAKRSNLNSRTSLGRSNGYDTSSSSSDDGSSKEIDLTQLKKSKGQTKADNQRSNPKSRQSLDRQTHSDHKVAKSRAEQLNIPRQITSPSELRWYKIRHKHNNKWELKICPCRVLSFGEARRVVAKERDRQPKEGDVVIQFLIGNKFLSVDDTTLFPFSNESVTAVDEATLEAYIEQQRSKGRKNVNVETEKLYLARVFEHAKRIEAESKAREQRDLKDYCGDSSEAPCDDIELRDTSDDEELQIPKAMSEEEDCKQNDSSVNGVLENPRTIFKEVEEEPADDGFLDCPYTQAMNFDPEANDLDEEISNEPMRPGDVIEYYSPIFVVGDKRGLRQAAVLAVSPDADVILNLSNGECLLEDTRVKRIKVMDGDELFDHPGIYRPITSFKLVAGKVKGGSSGIMNEAARFGDIFRKNLGKMQAKAEADGFAPMDMLRNIMPGGRKAQTRKSSPSQSPFSSSESSTNETPKLPQATSKQSHFSLNSPTVSSKPSPRSLKRAMDTSDQPRRRNHQTSYDSSSSSDGSAGQTLAEIARRKNASQGTSTKSNEKNSLGTTNNIDKENINNSCEEKRGSITHTDSPAASLGSSLASSAPSLGPSFASSPSSSATGSPTKYRKVETEILPPSAIDLSAEMSSESSSDEGSPASSKKTNEKIPVSSSRRNPLSEDDISDSDDDLYSRKKHTSWNAKRMSRQSKSSSQSSSWTKRGTGWEKSAGSSSLLFSRYK